MMGVVVKAESNVGRRRRVTSLRVARRLSSYFHCLGSDLDHIHDL
jgi:hypothetical protein